MDTLSKLKRKQDGVFLYKKGSIDSVRQIIQINLWSYFK